MKISIVIEAEGIKNSRKFWISTLKSNLVGKQEILDVSIEIKFKVEVGWDVNIFIENYITEKKKEVNFKFTS